MSPQRDNMTIKQVQEQYMENEVSLWILGSSMTTSRMES